jgi:glycine/D-amino acid oxidase-like deaminating enzyme
MKEARVAILGAGLFGSGLALELSRLGLPSLLIDRDFLPLQRAARRNEGKIHLGLVYAGEDSPRTAALMLEGALSFRAIVGEWLREEAWSRLSISTPYHYLVHRDSLLTPDRLMSHYASVEQLYRDTIRTLPDVAEADYLGDRPESLWRPLEQGELERYRGAPVHAGYATVERAIDPGGLCDALTKRVLRDPAITWRGEIVVEAVTPQKSGGLRVRGWQGEERWQSDHAVVVNGTWDSRLAIDSAMGLPLPANHLQRLKYRVLVSLPKQLRGAPSQTLVLGRFGDIVIHPTGEACLSWYPEGLRGWSNALLPPASWNEPCLGRPEAGKAAEIASATLRALDAFLPGLAKAQVLQVDAGVIVARGSSDVNDPASGLHSRCAIGLLHQGSNGYLSVDQGKWTTAPLLARRVAANLAHLRGTTGS